MTTKKEIIIKKFLQYESDIKTIVNTSIIPSLEDIDVLDLLLYINLYFNNEQDKQKTIIYLIDMQGLNLTQEQLTKAMPMTLDLIEWILNFQKHN
jgi:hypothetical protein